MMPCLIISSKTFRLSSFSFSRISRRRSLLGFSQLSVSWKRYSSLYRTSNFIRLPFSSEEIVPPSRVTKRFNRSLGLVDCKRRSRSSGSSWPILITRSFQFWLRGHSNCNPCYGVWDISLAVVWISPLYRLCMLHLLRLVLTLLPIFYKYFQYHSYYSN